MNIDQNEISNKLLVIGKQHELTIEQIGQLEDLVKQVLAGRLHPNDFVEALEDTLGIEGDPLTALARDVNVEIFLAIRESLMNMHQSSVENVDVTESKEDILAEIERPSPARPTSSQPRQEDHDAAHEFIGANLSGNVAMPAQKAQVEVKKVSEKPKNYSNDPYREPIS